MNDELADLNDMLSLANLNMLETGQVLELLRVTIPLKDKLPNRAKACQYARKALSKSLGRRQAREFLRGME